MRRVGQLRVSPLRFLLPVVGNVRWFPERAAMSSPLDTLAAQWREEADTLCPLLTAKQVAAILGVRTKRVYELGIPAVRISARQLRWRPSAVQQWIADREAR